MDTARITYLNELRTEAEHLRSGEKIITDAPVDNKGRGAAFSPTDLLATSLATCMITTIGIKVVQDDLPVTAMTARVVKHMVADPRRVQRVEIELEVAGNDLGDEQRATIERTARNCPVALSLHPDLVQDLMIVWK